MYKLALYRLVDDYVVSFMRIVSSSQSRTEIVPPPLSSPRPTPFTKYKCFLLSSLPTPQELPLSNFIPRSADAKPSLTPSSVTPGGGAAFDAISTSGKLVVLGKP